MKHISFRDFFSILAKAALVFFPFGASANVDALGELIKELENKNKMRPQQSYDPNCEENIENKPRTLLPSFSRNNGTLSSIETRPFSHCMSRTGGYYFCKIQGTEKPLSFKFQNDGNSQLIPEKNSKKNRTWDFFFQNQQRRDLHLRITDAPNETNSQLRESYIFLFPRKHTPAIRLEGAKMIVTLPTGEEVIYNAKTKDVVSGVFAETGPITPVSKELNPPKVEYRGSGVMIRVDARGTEPRAGGGFAQISKGGKSCKVPKKDLWPEQETNSIFQFRFAEDAELDTFLRKTCGFGI